MTFETWFRLAFGLIAIGMAGFLVGSFVTGRTRVGGRAVDRRTAPRTWWGSAGKIAMLMTGLAIASLLPPERDVLPIVFLGLFSGQLLEMLVSSTAQMPSVAYQRAVQPKPYWLWVAFHAVVVIALLVFLVMQRDRPIIL